MHRTDQWQSLVGEPVHVWLDGQLYREGFVDAAMGDGSALWVAADALNQREYIDAASGYEVWTNLYPRSKRDGTASVEVTNTEPTAQDADPHTAALTS